MLQISSEPLFFVPSVKFCLIAVDFNFHNFFIISNPLYFGVFFAKMFIIRFSNRPKNMQNLPSLSIFRFFQS